MVLDVKKEKHYQFANSRLVALCKAHNKYFISIKK